LFYFQLPFGLCASLFLNGVSGILAIEHVFFLFAIFPAAGSFYPPIPPADIPKKGIGLFRVGFIRGGARAPPRMNIHL
jgi:hypothetical protein